MTPALRRVGAARQPVVTVDGFTGAPARGVALAAALAPLPVVRDNWYPGRRRVVDARDGAAMAWMAALVERAAPFVGGAFDADAVDLLEASFSLVTTRPDRLAPPQRTPHFDSTDPDYLAMMLYLAPTAGTAFFRQAATGIEVVDAANADRFVAAARAVAGAATGYVADGDPAWERLDAVAGVPDRLVIYRGGLLHSGLIAPDDPLSDDPRRGRLTANLFLRARRAGGGRVVDGR